MLRLGAKRAAVGVLLRYSGNKGIISKEHKLLGEAI